MHHSDITKKEGDRERQILPINLKLLPNSTCKNIIKFLVKCLSGLH